MIGLGLPDINELGWRLEGLADLSDSRRAERTDVQRRRHGRIASARRRSPSSTPRSDEFVPLAEVAEGARRRQGAEETVGREGLEPPFQRQPGRVRSAPARGDRVGPTHNATALRLIVPERLRQALPVAVGLSLFLAALEVLRARAAHGLLARAGRATSSPRRSPRLALARRSSRRSNYAALTGYDLLAFAYIGKRLPRRQIAARVLSGLRDLQQRRLRDAVRRVGPLSLLHPLGRHGRGALAHRLLVLGDVLARAVRARRPEPGARAAARDASCLPGTTAGRSPAGS